MALSEKKFIHHSRTGMKLKIYHWQSKMARAIEHKEMKLISNTPEIFKTAGWINFGISAAARLSPGGSTTTALIENYSLHLWAASTMLSGLEELYKIHARDFNQLLSQHHSKIKKALILGTEAMQIDYLVSPITNKVLSNILTVAKLNKRLESPIMNEAMAEAYTARMIMKAELLDSESDPLESRVDTVLDSLGKKLVDVYKGSMYGFGHDRLFELDYGNQTCRQNAYPFPWIDPFTGKPSACKPKYTYISGGSPTYNFGSWTQSLKNRHEKLHHLLANLWRYETTFRDIKLSPHDTAFVRKDPSAQTPSQIIAMATDARLENNLGRLKKVEADVWSHLSRVSQGKPSFTF